MNKTAAVLSVVVASLALAACPKETVGGKIDDALDNRPAEKVQDKLEDMKDSVKDATN